MNVELVTSVVCTTEIRVEGGRVRVVISVVKEVHFLLQIVSLLQYPHTTQATLVALRELLAGVFLGMSD